MRDDAETIRRYLDGHRAAEARQRELLRREGPDPARAVEEAQDALDALAEMGLFPGPRDPAAEREILEVRERWVRVKRRAGAP